MSYKVGNPHRIPEELAIIRWPCEYRDSKGVLKTRKGMTEDVTWHEGDDFKRPVGMSDKSFSRLLKQGFIYEPEVVE